MLKKQKLKELQETQQALRNEAKSFRDEAYNALTGLDDETSKDIIAANSRNIEPTEKVDSTDADFTTPTKLNGNNLFRLTNNNTPYSESNPIPVAGVVEGLIFKVQVGAFSKPIPQTTFKRFAPMSTETIRNNIKRYLVGYFSTTDPAYQARDQIRNLGYSDAFVVAYLNGKRISMAEARRIMESGEIPENNNVIAENQNESESENGNENGNGNGNLSENENGNGNENENENENLTENSENSTNQVNNNNSSENTTNNTVDSSTPSITNGTNDASGNANASEVNSINGLFFTVQVGVYNKPVPASTLKNISPLNSQVTENNQVRYSTGVFKSVDEALQRRGQVRAIGISDAFVTAYYNGKRITVGEARRLIAEQGEGILNNGTTSENTTPNENNTSENNENTNTQPEATNNNENNIVESLEAPSPEGIYFRVDLGTYGTDVPQEIAKFLIDNNFKIENETMVDGNINFYTNKIDNYQDAEKLKQKLVDDGLARAFVRAYYKYDEITIGSAMKILSGEKVTIKPINSDLDIPENVIEEPKTNDVDSTSQNTTTEEPEQLSPADYNKEAIHFKLILGTFDGEVPGDKASFLIESGIKTELDDLGRTTFFRGNFKTFEEADNYQKDLIQRGFEGSEVKAYYKFEEISVDLAKIILEYK